MKNWLFCFFIISLFASCKNTQQFKTDNNNFVRLNYLFENHQYFLLADEIEKNKKQLSESEMLILSAKLNSVFNRKEMSNSAIEELFKNHKNQLADSTKVQLLEIEMNNSVLLYDYKKALEISEKIIDFPNALSEEERTDFDNNRTIFEILKNVPKQAISISETSLQITKDIAGLSRIPVKLGNTEQSVVFDTGANFSVITDSLAVKVGLKILDGTFKVTAITGTKVDSQIAVAELLKIGNTTLSNVIFLVFPEASLSFPQANYSIEAIIGFPVIEALKEISIVKDSLFYIPKNQSLSYNKNLALHFLTPVVEVIENNRSLPFTFDTGASETMLYHPYLMDYRTEILQKSTLDSIQIGGAGGSKFIEIYHTPFSGKIGGKEFKLENTTVNPEKNREYKAGIYGNLGKDVVKQFDTITLNFEKMFLKLN